MIIYHARPCREYPILSNQIQNKYNNLGIYQFHEAFEMIDITRYEKKIGILNYSPLQTVPNYAYFPAPNSITTKTGLIDPSLNGLYPMGKYNKQYKINFIYGIFPRSRIKKTDNTFIFTVLENPIDYIYNSFSYSKFSSLNNCTSSIKHLAGNFFNCNTEKFIDNFILNSIPNFKFQNNDYKLIDEIFYCKCLNLYDFIVFRENLEIGFKKLKDMTRLNLSCPKINSSIIKNNNYRRADLEELFKDDIIEYNKMKEKFLK